MSTIRDSVAFVTGGNRGFGRALAEVLLDRGAKKVYVGVRNPSAVTFPGVEVVALDVDSDESVAAAARQASDVTLLINNAGIGEASEGPLSGDVISQSQRAFQTNYYGTIRASKAFAPIIVGNGGGGIINVLSDAAWYSRPMVTAYAASKAAVWSYTNALRLDLRDSRVQVVGLHVGFLDTDFVAALDVKKSDPRAIAAITLEGFEVGLEEILADPQANLVKETLGTDRSYYMDPAPVA
jgi:NAD(P)-dependent dehydrogenase (short-subunit alcohol dehydrogenase family)